MGSARAATILAPIVAVSLSAWLFAQAGKSTALLRTDTDCKWSLDGVSKGVLKADARLQVPIALGQHLVEANSLDGTLHWEKTFDVNDTKMQVWQIELEKAPWTDPATGSTWMRRDNGADISWQEAVDYCRNLNVAGHSDWRLPTLFELFSLRSGSTYPFSLRGSLSVTGWLWEAYVPSRPELAGWYQPSEGGGGSGIKSGSKRRFVRDNGEEVGLRALCVRGTASPQGR